MLASLSIITTGCGTTSQNIDDYSAFPSGKPRTSRNDREKTDNKDKKDEKDTKGKRNNNKRHAKRAPSTSDKHDTQSGSSDQWKLLDIKLGRHDNKELYDEIKSWLGTPYQGGAHKKQKGTDCSGFVMELYLNVYDMMIERNSARIYTKNCEPIAVDELREGDLVFFHNGDGESISHVGIYLKENKFAHASSSRGVVIDDLTSRYYTKHFYGAGRVIGKKY